VTRTSAECRARTVAAGSASAEAAPQTESAIGEIVSGGAELRRTHPNARGGPLTIPANVAEGSR
jgi:hypothetical protein